MGLAGATILQVTPELASGGVERTTIEVAEALTQAGAHALVASAGGRMERELERLGAELIRIPTAASKNPIHIAANATRIARIIRERAVDLVHARSRAPAWSAYWAARQTRIPFVTTYHGIYNARTSLKQLYNSVMSRGDVVIANSEFTADHIRRAHPDAAHRVVAIPRGVDIGRFTPDAVSEDRKERLRQGWGLPHGYAEILILLPARMTAWKGHREAVAAAALLKERNLPPWRMVFAGDTGKKENYVTDLKQLLSRAGLEDMVSLVGHCDDMPAAFALADITLAPSTEPEAFGRVAAEAGAMGAPVVASNLGGQKEVVVNGVTGLLVEAGDVGGLADALEQTIMMGPEGRRALGAAAQMRIRERYTVQALQSATLSVYEKLLGGQGAPGQ